MLVQHAPDLWTVDHALTLGGFLPMGTRTTVIRLADGRVMVVAPGDLVADDVAAIRAIGPVAAVVAPNPMHWMFLAKAAEELSAAEVWAAPGVEKKMKEVGITGTFDGRGGPWSETVEVHRIEGADKLGETVIFDPRSRTLVLTDLCFNLRNVEGWLARTNLKMLDAYGKFGPSWLMRNLFTTDKAALRKSVDRILAWEPGRVVVTHGEVLGSGGTEELRRAFGWLG